jgi:hypothetical protein
MSRPALHHLTAQTIAPLEVRITAFPEVWQELARSHYCTLLGRGGWPDCMPLHEAVLADLAEQAAALAMGIGEDMGGAQPYIPIGLNFTASEKNIRVVRAWRGGQPWQHIAASEKITPRRVRQIVNAWQHENFAQRQGTLALK